VKSHLKPLFIQAKIKNIGVKKVLVDVGAAVKLLPQSLLKKIGLSYASQSYQRKSLIDLIDIIMP